MNKTTIQEAFKILAGAFPEARKPIGLHEPSFSGQEWNYVKDCLDSGWVSSVGEYVNRFERMLEEYTGVNHAIATVNGTAALHICLILAGVSADDEVLIPSLTFVATANAVRYCGAIPHFVDVDLLSLGIDTVKLRTYLEQIAIRKSDGCYNRNTGRRIRGLVVMHTFGHPSDLDSIQSVCQEYNITLIEDAAEALGSFYKGKHCGNWGASATLSFNGNKVVTCGGGGAILTNNKDIAQQARHITTTAKLPHAWEFYHDQTGYNYRMPNINAALGCAQLEKLPTFIREKREIAKNYHRLYANFNGAHVFNEQQYSSSNYWLNLLIFSGITRHERDELLGMCHEANILCRPIWTPMHRLPMYESCPRMDLSITEKLHERVICLPSGTRLSRHE
ncbi:MAG: LegC family aminotransferase [Gammaproteobacteria bacterium]|nr:LegC family aminotransferase [Gammaproteobacteria bacterium]